MKLNVLKFATGGQTYFSAIPNPYARGLELALATGTSTESDDSGLVPKAVLNELLKNGLPNDVDAFMKRVASFEQMGFSELDKNGLYQLLSLANTVIKLGDFLKTAEENAYKNNAIDEIAISPKSELFVINQDLKIEKVHILKFNPKKHYAMTVGELLEYRKYAPELTYNTEIATITANSVGLEKIQDYIKGIIQTIGSSESINEAQGDLQSLIGRAAQRPTKNQFEELVALEQVMGEYGTGALFLYKEKEKSKNVNDAFKYIMSILPSNMKSQLLANSVAQGMSYSDAATHATQTIINALIASNDTVSDYSIKYDQSLNKAAKTVAGQLESVDTRRQTTTEMFFNLNLDRTTVTISDANYKNKYVIEAKGSVIPSLTIDGGAGVGSGPLDQQLEAGGKGMGKYLDINNTWFGYDKVNPELLSKVLYKGDLIGNVWLPTTEDGDIDWQSLHNFAQAEEYIKSHNIVIPQEKNKVHALFGSPATYDANGELQKLNLGNFMMIHGITLDDYLSGDNLLYREVDKDREKLLEEEINIINKNRKSNIENPGLFESYVELPIFIKIRPNAGLDASYYAKQGSLVPEQTLLDDMAMQLRQQAPTMLVFGNAAALYGNN